MNSGSIMIAKDYLISNDIFFLEYNNGVHLRAEGPYGYMDFWPTTGTWIIKGRTEKHFGLFNLIDYILENRKAIKDASSTDTSVSGS